MIYLFNFLTTIISKKNVLIPYKSHIKHMVQMILITLSFDLNSVIGYNLTYRFVYLLFQLEITFREIFCFSPI